MFGVILGKTDKQMNYKKFRPIINPENGEIMTGICKLKP
jgi:hypothetical protein